MVEKEEKTFKGKKEFFQSTIAALVGIIDLQFHVPRLFMCNIACIVRLMLYALPRFLPPSFSVSF